MAYWMTHLRVAQALLPCLPQGISLPHYYAGSIAPDCGRTEQNPDGTPRYLPGNETRNIRKGIQNRFSETAREAASSSPHQTTAGRAVLSSQAPRRT